MKTLLIIIQVFIFKIAIAGWKVDCGNYCFFNEFQNNCQGVFYQANPSDNQSKVYSRWNKNLKGCLANDLSENVYKLLKPQNFSCDCPSKDLSPPSNKWSPITVSTKNELRVLRAKINSWVQCAPNPDIINPVDPLEVFSVEEVRKCQSERRQWGESTTPINPGTCLSGLFPWTSPSDCNYSGDMPSEVGAFCLEGMMEYCHEIKDAQDRATGAWYRNPYLKRFPFAPVHQPFFSRDQLNGALAYWLKTRDQSSLLNWIKFVKQNGKTAPWGPTNLYNLCPPRPDGNRPNHISQSSWDHMLADDRCAVLNVTWGAVYSVAKHIGIKDRQLAKISDEILSNMKIGFSNLDSYYYLESQTLPTLGWKGFQASNAINSIHVRMASGGNNNKVLDAAKILSKRSSHLNPFYHYLAANRTSTEYGAYLIKKYCSHVAPKWGGWYRSGKSVINNPTLYYVRGANLKGSGFQFMGGLGVYEKKVTPNGHDCLFFLNLYIGDNKKTVAKCKPGDKLINGACQFKRFKSPEIVKIPGISYRFNPWTAELAYKAIHNKECPYGGNVQQGNYYKECVRKLELDPNQLNKNISYEVNWSESSPGIYYSPIKSRLGLLKVKNCPYGGRLYRGKCRLIGFKKPTLRQSVSYWVDSNPRWPGVYYEQVNGTCPYGGDKAGPNCLLIGLSGLNSSEKYFIRRNPAYPGVYYHTQDYEIEDWGNPPAVKEFEAQSMDRFGGQL